MGNSTIRRGLAVTALAAVFTGGAGGVAAGEDVPAPEPGPAASPTSAGEGDAIVSADWGDVTRRQEDVATSSAGVWRPERDVTSMAALAESQGLHTAWREGMTGKGVTVAVIDTGIAPVDGLNDKDDKVMDGPDLSFDSFVATTRHLDEFGHGTHMAGIIAGRDEEWDRKEHDASQFAGVAPDAQLLDLKVGAADGGVDVSQVIAALDWVVQHRKEGGMDVRVVSLAYGTHSLQSWQVDPLARAVENAWRAGIVVVVAAGNDGDDAPNLLMPALDPHVLTVGAVDLNGTPTTGDDRVADFSSVGSGERRPDVVAPGRSLVSLRVPGSYADVMSPEGRIEGDTSGRFFRGSGTSQATAFVAGQVALLLEERPKLTPDQVKSLLVSTARPVAGGGAAAGAGVTDIMAAATAPTPAAPAGTIPWSTGRGSLELSRGGEHVVDPATGVALTGEVDALGQAWDAESWLAKSSAGTSWYKGTWNGRTWTGEKFDKHKYKHQAWTGSSWSGVPWASRQDSSGSWEARSWRGQDWKARSWRGDSWKARSWRALF